MSATIPENMLLSDLLKSTGYDCPDSLKEKTFDESTSGGSEVVLENNKEATIDVSSYTAPVEITPSEGKDAMKKATVTLSNIPEIEANKAQTIDVSTYTEPVEITPTAGKDGMAKATVTLSNIPSGGSATGYHWSDNVQNKEYWFSFGISPTDKTAFENSKYMDFTIDIANAFVKALRVESCAYFFGEGASYTLTKVSDTQFIVTYEGQDITFTRDDTGDFTLW